MYINGLFAGEARYMWLHDLTDDESRKVQRLAARVDNDRFWRWLSVSSFAVPVLMAIVGGVLSIIYDTMLWNAPAFIIGLPYGLWVMTAHEQGQALHQQLAKLRARGKAYSLYSYDDIGVRTLFDDVVFINERRLKSTDYPAMLEFCDKVPAAATLLTALLTDLKLTQLAELLRRYDKESTAYEFIHAEIWNHSGEQLQAFIDATATEVHRLQMERAQYKDIQERSRRTLDQAELQQARDTVAAILGRT